MRRFFNKINPFRYITSTKHIVILVLSLTMLFIITLSFFRTRSNDNYFEARNLSHDYENTLLTDVYDLPLYSAILADYRRQNISDTLDERAITTAALNGMRINDAHLEWGNIVENYITTRTSDDVLYLDEQYTVKFNNPNAESGLYYIAIDYYELENTIENTQIDIKINGLNPFYESQTLVLPSKWQFNSNEFLLDRYENEIQPSSVKLKDWYQHTLNDYRGMHPGYFAFYLEAGDEITISYVNGELLIGQIYYVLQEDIPTYQQYLTKHGDHPVIDKMIQIAARDIHHRTDPSIRLRPEQDPSNLYYNTQFLRQNVIFGDSWQNSGQAVTYEIEVETSGYYHLSFKYRQYLIKDMSVFRKIKINDEVPYDLLESYAFPYTLSFINRTLVDENEAPLKVYLEAGTNTITLEAVNYPYRQAIETIRYVMKEIQQLSLSIKRYTSGGTDRYRDWDIETFFPDASANMIEWANILERTHSDLLVLAMTSEPSEIGNLKVSADRLRNIAADINKLPSRMVQFSDGDSSINQILGNLMQQMLRSSLELERTMIHGDVKIPNPYANIFTTTFEGMKRLVLSFINNPYSTRKRSEGELMVWVNHPRQYIEIMQTMIDQQYRGDMKITLSQMPDQNKLILANATGESPDIAIGVNHWIPYEFAIRQASLDLRQFAGYEALVQNFSKGAMIPFVFEQGVYGLPGTQNFWVTYYRRDILDSIGITEIPQTWDEIISILPLLQSYGMNYYVPLAMFSGLKPYVATLPFIYQFGGDLYTPDGMQTAINSEQTLVGIRLMSELFTLYNMPKFVGNFYNHFRYGLLPIGISDLSTYLLLQTAAVELDGLWGMDLHPGVYNEEADEIIRYAAIGGQANMILSTTEYPEESWDFMRWWMSTEVQSEFAFVLQSTYGKAYFWNTANINAFKELPMPREYKNIILKQWEYGIEASRIPGNYMVEREISNAWTRIVFEGANPRQALDEAVRISNREILYKMGEFGYTKDGVIIKEYIVPSIFNIDEWLTEVNHD